MSHINFDYLTESFLFGSGLLDDYKGYSDSQLLNELRNYREHVLSHLDSIKLEIANDDRKLKIIIESFGNRPDENTFKQLALYMDCILIEDPLFSMTETKSDSSKAMMQFLGMTTKEDLDRNRLVDAVQYMKDNTRLIVCNFLKFIPISLLHEAPNEIPIIYDENGFSKSLPEHIQRYLISRLDVRNIVLGEGCITVQLKQELQKGTGLYLFFPDCQDRAGEIVVYQKMEKTGTDDNSIFSTVKFHIPDYISQYEFDIWLNQSKNRAALQFFNETMVEYSLAEVFGGMYLTKSQLRSDILSMTYNKDFPFSDIANLSMKIRLPILEKIGIADLIEIREQYGESFKNFRVDLGMQLIKLRGIENSEELKQKLTDVALMINETSVNDIDKELKRIKNSVGTDLMITVGSLLTSYIGNVDGSVASNAFTIAGIATGAFTILNGAKSNIKDYLNLKNKPGYFLWKIENKPWDMR